MGTSGWDKFKTSRKRLRAVSAKERAHIDQASQEAVRLLLTLLLLLLVLASYYIKLIIADCCFACTPRVTTYRVRYRSVVGCPVGSIHLITDKVAAC